MIQYKNYTILKNIKIKFVAYTKKKNYLNNYLKFHTKRIIVNRAPKHFNIGQHSIKMRLYGGEFNFNCDYVGLTPAYFLLGKKLFLKIQLQPNEIPTKIVLYYSAKFKFKINVIYN